jgi:hypothetical protein
MAAANYLTPVLVELLNITNIKNQNGIAFIAGFIGLKLVEIISENFIEKLGGNKAPIQKTKRKIKKS